MSEAKRSPWQFWRRDDGAVAVEFALVLPILVVLVFGIVQFGLFFNRQQGIHAAAREGARIGALSSTTSEDIVARIDDALSGISLPNGRTITIEAPSPYGSRTFGPNSTPDTDSPCDGNFGESLAVTVKSATTLEIPLWGTSNLDVTGTGDFRCETT